MIKQDKNIKVDGESKELFKKELFGNKEERWRIYVTYENEKEIYNSEIYKKVEIYKTYTK